MEKVPLFITCVPPDRPHPSGRLASRISEYGFDVCVLFENARSVKFILWDARKLISILNKRAHSRAVINVNGSLAQMLAIGLCHYHGLTTTLWIMDSYPGCLRYVTRLWWVYYPFFFVATVIAKILADRVLVIDESFINHWPSWTGFRNRCAYVPLPQMLPLAKGHGYSQQSVQVDLIIGVLGNIERKWLNHDFLPFYREARRHGYRVLVATSQPIDVTLLSGEGIDCVIPWPKSETDRVFNQCTAVLVPLTTPRLVYSSPSKIIDCYMRGIQPVVMVNKSAWDRNCKRMIYAKCIHVSDFFSGVMSNSTADLVAYSTHWVAIEQAGL